MSVGEMVFLLTVTVLSVSVCPSVRPPDVDCKNVFALVTKKMNEEERRYAFSLVDEAVRKIDFLTTLSKTICNSTCRADYVSLSPLTSQSVSTCLCLSQ